MENGSSNKAQGTGNEGLNREVEMTETTFDTIADIDNLTAKELKDRRYGLSLAKADGTSVQIDYFAGRGREKIGRGYSVTWFVADDTAEYGCRLIGPVCGDKFQMFAAMKIVLQEWMTDAPEKRQDVGIAHARRMDEQRMKDKAEDKAETAEQKLRAKTTEHPKAHVGDRGLPEAKFSSAFLTIDSEYGQVEVQFGDALLRNKWSVILTGVDDWNTFVETFLDDDRQVMCSSSMDFPHEYSDDPKVWRLAYTLSGHSSDIDASVEWSRRQRLYIDNDTSTAADRDGYILHEGDTVRPDCPVPEIHGTVGKVLRMRTAPEVDPFECDDDTPTEIIEVVWVDTGKVLEHGNVELVKVRPTADDPAPSTDCVPCPNCGEVVAPNMKRCPGCTRDNDAHVDAPDSMPDGPDFSEAEDYCDRFGAKYIIVEADGRIHDTNDYGKHTSWCFQQRGAAIAQARRTTNHLYVHSLREVVNVLEVPTTAKSDDAFRSDPKVPQFAGSTSRIVEAAERFGRQDIDEATVSAWPADACYLLAALIAEDATKASIIRDLQEDVRDLVAERDAARESFVEAHGKLDALDTKYTEVLLELDDTRNQSEAKSRTIGTLRDEVESLETEVGDLADEIIDLRKERDAFRTELRERAIALDVTAAEADKHWIEIVELRSRIATLRATMKADRRAAVTAFAVGDTVQHAHPEVLNTGTVIAVDHEDGRVGIEWDDGLRTVCYTFDLRKVSDSDVEADTIEVLSEMVSEKDEKIAELELTETTLRARIDKAVGVIKAERATVAQAMREITDLEAKLDEQKKCSKVARRAAIDMTKKACSKAAVLAERIAEHVVAASDNGTAQQIHLDGLMSDPDYYNDEPDNDEETLRQVVRAYIEARS